MTHCPVQTQTETGKRASPGGACGSAWHRALRFCLFAMLAMVPAAIYAIRRGRVSAHRRAMIGLFIGGLIIPGLFTLLPGRVLGRLLTDGVTLLTLAQQ